jgi:hypothetical protein
MATIFGSVQKLIHDTAQSLLDNNVTADMSNMVTSFVSSGFGVVIDTLKVVRDVTAPAPPPPAP